MTFKALYNLLPSLHAKSHLFLFHPPLCVLHGSHWLTPWSQIQNAFQHLVLSASLKCLPNTSKPFTSGLSQTLPCVRFPYFFFFFSHHRGTNCRLLNCPSHFLNTTVRAFIALFWILLYMLIFLPKSCNPQGVWLSRREYTRSLPTLLLKTETNCMGDCGQCTHIESLELMVPSMGEGFPADTSGKEPASHTSRLKPWNNSHLTLKYY